MFKKELHSPWLDLAVFAVIIGFFLFSAARLVDRNYRGNQGVQLEQEVTRKPTSVSRQTQGENKNEPVAEIELPCVTKENHRQATGANYVRISGSACTPGKTAIATGQGRNQANGSEILCFTDKARDRISTNYFQLVPGINRVELELVWANGMRRRSFLEIQKFTE